MIGKLSTNPTPDQIRAARLAAGLTQKAAAESIYCSSKAWEKWEQGARKMHPAFFDYFLIKIRDHK